VRSLEASLPSAFAFNQIGYTYCGGTSCTSVGGTQGNIYTINPFVPTSDFITEWVMAVFSYTNGNYMQLGYLKCGNWLYTVQYMGTTNNYWLCKTSPWTGPQPSTSFTTAVDVQAEVENSNTCIVITNTHFSTLQYLGYNPNPTWFPWAQHSVNMVSPYTVNQISNSEFTASGGTGC
jgi:hypothetical protein